MLPACKRLLNLLIVLALAAAVLGQGLTINQNLTGFDQRQLQAGEPYLLSVFLENSGNGTAENVDLDISVESSDLETESTTINAGNIAAGGTKKVAIPIRINEYAETRSYVVLVTARSGEETLGNLVVVADVIGKETVDLSIDTKELDANNKARMGVKITNKADVPIYGISLSLDKNDYFVPISMGSTIGSLEPGAETVAYIDIFVQEDALGGIELPIRLTYNIGSKSRTDIFGPGVTISEKAKAIVIINDIIISPTHGEPGGESKAILYIKNAGVKDANSVKVSVGSVEGAISPIEKVEYMLGYLGAYATKSVEVKMKVASTAQPDTYQVPITIEYSENEKIYTVERTIGIDVIGKANLNIIDIVTDPIEINPGADFILKIYARNIGSETARSVDMGLDLPSGISGGAQKYVASVPEGESIAMEFELHVDQNMFPDNYQIPMTLTYIQNGGSAEETRNIILTVKKVSENPYFFIGIAMLMLLLIAIIYVKKPFQ